MIERSLRLDINREASSPESGLFNLRLELLDFRVGQHRGLDFVTAQTGVWNSFLPRLACSSTGTKTRARQPHFSVADASCLLVSPSLDPLFR